MKTFLLISVTCVLVGYSADTGIVFKRLPSRTVRQSLPVQEFTQPIDETRKTLLELNGTIYSDLAVMQSSRVPDVPNRPHVNLGNIFLVLTNATDTFTFNFDACISGDREDSDSYVIHESATGSERSQIPHVFIRLLELEPHSKGKQLTSIAVDFTPVGAPTAAAGRLRINSVIP